MRLYYKTTRTEAKVILSDGFKVKDSQYVILTELTGIWLSDLMVNSNKDSSETVLLAVDLELTEEEISRYVIEDVQIPFLEYSLPAALINKKGTIQVVKDKAEKELAYLEYLDGLLKENA